MGSYTFKIGSTTYDLGIVKSIVVKRIVNKFPVPPLVAGETVELLNWGETYREFQISGRFVDTEANINTFLSAIESAEKNLTQCTLSSRFSGITLQNVLVNGFDYTDNGGEPGYVDYTLILIEGIPIV